MSNFFWESCGFVIIFEAPSCGRFAYKISVIQRLRKENSYRFINVIPIDDFNEKLMMVPLNHSSSPKNSLPSPATISRRIKIIIKQ